MNGFSKNHVENMKASLNKEALIVSLGAKLRIAKLKKVREWFLNNEIMDLGDPAENFFPFQYPSAWVCRHKENIG